jgi:heme/copper-type cytochrome/quinol oxidase subunit 1
MDRRQEIVYLASIIILGMVAGALWFHPLLAGHVMNEKALKVLSIGFTMWLVGMINSAAMLLYELWEWWTERRKP